VKEKIMETRANFVLIGAFTLFGILGSLGFFLWLAKVEVDRQYAYYDILFENVSGLGEAGDVRYNGLPVGQTVATRVRSSQAPSAAQSSTRAWEPCAIACARDG